MQLEGIKIDELYRIGDENEASSENRFRRADSKNSIDTDFLYHTGDSKFKTQE